MMYKLLLVKTMHPSIIDTSDIHWIYDCVKKPIGQTHSKVVPHKYRRVIKSKREQVER